MNTPTPEQLHAAILRTIAYFDVFDFPLKFDEIWRWLYREGGATWTAEAGQVRQAVDHLVTIGKLQSTEDWLTLPGRGELVNIRRQRIADNEKKWKKIAGAARFLEVVPYVKMVAVVNTLAINNARPESDIDVLVVTEPGRIWIARLMVTGLIDMLGIRRHGTHITNRVCLSFYVTSDAMDLSRFANGADDHHFAFWTTQAVPVLDLDTYKKFVEANRAWTSRLPNAWSWIWDNRLISKNRLLRGIKNFYGRLFGTAAGQYLEAWARDFQMQRMEKNVDSKAKEGTTDVVISEEALKFHEADRRNEYNAAYAERCRALGIAP